MKQALKKVSFGFFVVAGGFIASLIAEPSKESHRFSFSGELEAFNKFGFYNGISPTDSYGYILGTISGIYSHKFANDSTLRFELGGAGAGLAYDSTKTSQTGGLAYNYIGYYAGYRGSRAATATNTHNFYIHNAHLAYDSERISLKAGRFMHNDDNYVVGLMEGADLRADFAKFDKGGIYGRVEGVSAFALLGDGFFWDFTQAYAPNGLLGAQFGGYVAFGEASKFDINAFYYYGISEYSAPGIDMKLDFDSTKEGADSSKKGFASSTRINAIFPIYDTLKMEVAPLLGNFLRNTSGSNEGFTSSILARQDFRFYTGDKGEYLLGVAAYKNIGLSHARVGLYGSPLGINIWDNSVYGIGPSLNGIVYKDAISAFVFTQASYENLATFLQALQEGLDFRYTTNTGSAKALEEYSLKLSLDFVLTKNVSFGLIANYYTSIVFDNRSLNTDFGGSGGEVARGKSLDRSYVMTKISLSI